MTEPRYLRPKEAAAYLRMGASTLRQYVAEGRIPSHTLPGCRIRWFDVRELDAFVRGDYRPQLRGTTSRREG